MIKGEFYKEVYNGELLEVEVMKIDINEHGGVVIQENVKILESNVSLERAMELKEQEPEDVVTTPEEKKAWYKRWFGL